MSKRKTKSKSTIIAAPIGYHAWFEDASVEQGPDFSLPIVAWDLVAADSTDYADQIFVLIRPFWDLDESAVVVTVQRLMYLVDSAGCMGGESPYPHMQFIGVAREPEVLSSSRIDLVAADEAAS